LLHSGENLEVNFTIEKDWQLRFNSSGFFTFGFKSAVMNRLLLCLFLLFNTSSFSQSSDSLIIRKLFEESLVNGSTYHWLGEICSKIGPRVSGSPQAEMTVNYLKKELDQLSLDSVYLQDVMVPHWVRGKKEAAYFIDGKEQKNVNICALGGSIATPKGGLKASVIEVHNFDELKALGKEKVQGKIVFMNHPMKLEFINTFEAYGEAAGFRWATAMRAGALGAVGVVVRSMTLSMDDYPHTGAMGYSDTIPKIPACAISTMGAESLSKALKQNKDLQFYFQQSSEILPDTLSHNVIGEIRGSEFPNEIIVVGGHVDAWDLGQGAHDDGAGVVESMEVLRLFKRLNIHPKRTIRFVGFMNEENGGKGGEVYAKQAKLRGEKTIAAIESDEGGFTPRGFSFNGDSLQAEFVKKNKSLLMPYGLSKWEKGYGGSDINHLEDQGTLLIGFIPDSQRYFEVHHAATDTFDKVSRRELEMSAASIASLVYMLSEYGVK